MTVFLDRQAARMAMREKERRQICPEIHYRKAKDGVVITGCYGTEGKVILPDEIDQIMIQSERDLVTLSSCNPLGHNYQRYIVYAERVE